MEDLIKALQIMLKYGNPKYPTICKHDELIIVDEINPDIVSAEDIIELDRLGFDATEEYGQLQFVSSRFGSA